MYPKASEQSFTIVHARHSRCRPVCWLHLLAGTMTMACSLILGSPALGAAESPLPNIVPTETEPTTSQPSRDTRAAGKAEATLPAWQPSEAEIKQVGALADMLARIKPVPLDGATMYYGTLTIVSSYNGRESRRGTGGLHLQLADGSWLLGLHRHVTPDKPKADTDTEKAETPSNSSNRRTRKVHISIETKELKKVTVADLEQHLKTGSQHERVKQRLLANKARIHADSLPIQQCAVNHITLINVLPDHGRYGLPLERVFCHWHKLGLPDAWRWLPFMVLHNIDGHADYVEPFKDTFMTLLSPTRHVQECEELELDIDVDEIEDEDSTQTLPDPVHVLRNYTIHKLFQDLNLNLYLLDQDQEPDKPSAAANSNKASPQLSKEERAQIVDHHIKALNTLCTHEGQQSIVNALVTAYGISKTCPVDAPLQQRLTSAMPKRANKNSRWNEVSEEWLSQISPEHLRQLEQAWGPRPRKRSTPAITFSDTDIAGLIALTNSTEPSRWVDSGRPRSIGDNALRILSELWHCDPRQIVGHKNTSPWSSSDRQSIATKLQQWWKANPQLHNDKSAQQLALLHLVKKSDLLYFIQKKEAAEQKVLLSNLAQQWNKQGPAKTCEFTTVSLISLADTVNVPELKAVVRQWPPQGPQRNVIIALNLANGDRQIFAKAWQHSFHHAAHAKPAASQGMLAQLAAKIGLTNTKQQNQPQHSSMDDGIALMKMACLKPDRSSQQAVEAILHGAPDSPGFGLLLRSMQQFQYSQDHWLPVLAPKEYQNNFFQGQVLTIYLSWIAQGLHDKRKAPTAVQNLHRSQMTNSHRICDFFGNLVSDMRWHFGNILGNDFDNDILEFELTATESQRDKKLQTMQTTLRPYLEKELKALKLAMPLLPVDDDLGDPESLY